MLDLASRLFNKKELLDSEVDEHREGASGHYADPHGVSQDGGVPEDGIKGAEMHTQFTTEQINTALAGLEHRADKLRLLATEPMLGAVTPYFGNYAARNCGEDPSYPQWEVFDVRNKASLGVRWDNLNGAVDYMQMLAARDAERKQVGTSIAAGLRRFSTVPS